MSGPTPQRKRPELRLVQPLSSAGMLPPHNLEAEAAVLSSVMLKADVFEDVAQLLDVVSWYSDANRLIWQAIERVRTAGQPVDFVTVATRLREDGRLDMVGGSAYLAQIVDATPAISNVQAHAAIVASLANRRRMIATLQELAASGYREVDDDKAWLSHVEDEVGRVRRERVVTEDVDIITSRDVMLSRLDDRQSLMLDGKRPGVPTGIPALDLATGGIHASQTLMISGPKKGFKTTFALQLATNVARSEEIIRIKGEPIARQRGVLIACMEQPHEELTETIAFQLGRVNRNKFQTGTATWEDFDMARRSGKLLESMPIRFACQPSITPSQLRAKVITNRALMAAKGVKLALVIVDYLQLMGPDPEWADPRNRESELDKIGKALRAMSVDPELRGIAWVALSQVNEDGELRGSRSLAQHCVSWWHLEVDKREASRDTYRRAMPAKVQIKLQRHGPSPLTVPLWCLSDVGAFDDGGE